MEIIRCHWILWMLHRHWGHWGGWAPRRKYIVELIHLNDLNDNVTLIRELILSDKSEVLQPWVHTVRNRAEYLAWISTLPLWLWRILNNKQHGHYGQMEYSRNIWHEHRHCIWWQNRILCWPQHEDDLENYGNIKMKSTSKMKTT